MNLEVKVNKLKVRMKHADIKKNLKTRSRKRFMVLKMK